MANNRLLLTCLRCRDTIPIARLQAGMEFIWLPARVTPEEYEAWLATHSVCGEDDPGLAVTLTAEQLEGVQLG